MKTPLRYLAHRIIHQGVEHHLAVLTVTYRGGLYEVDIRPFERETPGTSFHNGTIAVCGQACHPAEAGATANHYHPAPNPPKLIFF